MVSGTREQVSVLRITFCKLKSFISFTLSLADTFLKYKYTDLGGSVYVNVLNAYLQFFSWVPLSDFYTTELLLPIFECTVSNVSDGFEL